MSKIEELKTWSDSTIFATLFLSWFAPLYTFVAIAYKDLNWLAPLTQWNPEPSLITLWFVVWAVVLLTRLFQRAWVFWVPTNVIFAYILLSVGGFI